MEQASLSRREKLVKRREIRSICVILLCLVNIAQLKDRLGNWERHDFNAWRCPLP